MLRHLSSLVWRRKASHLLLLLEIGLAFVLVFAVSAMALHGMRLYRMPLGFEYDHAWSVTVERGRLARTTDDNVLFDHLLRAATGFPGVRHAALASFAPFETHVIITDVGLPDGSRRTLSNLFDASDGFHDAMRLRMVSGKWFSAADSAPGIIPVVINRRLADTLFPGGTAVGKQLLADANDPSRRETYRVAGVFEDYRGQGDFRAPQNFVIRRFDAQRPHAEVNALVLSMDPGTPRTMETTLARHLKAVVPGWEYRIAVQAEARKSQLRGVVAPFAGLAVVTCFLLIMVGFGLFGVLWQNTARRIPELGLRRALGATKRQVGRQIMAEQFLLSTLAICIALALMVQLPLSGALDGILDFSAFGMAAAMSAGAIYLLSFLASAYPAWHASRLSPTDALRHQ